MQDSSWLASAQRSQGVRLLVLSFLALLLLVPVGMVRDVIAERQTRRDEAVANVAASWGGAQRVAGPRLVVPFTTHWQETLKDGTQVVHEQRQVAIFLPQTLTVDGSIESESRHRGIFEVPVYRARLTLAGAFGAADFAALGVAPDAVDWAHAELVLGVAEVRAIDEAALRWGDEALAFAPGAGRSSPAEPAVHVPLGVRASSPNEFSIALALRGSEAIALAPFGGTTRVSLRSPWPSPSFEGAWSPSEREVGKEGFRATWRVASLGRGFPQQWLAPEEPSEAIEASSFGVRLLTPIDAYRMAERSAKYAVLFLALTFGTLWLFEVLAQTPLHTLQYLLVGAALCLFFLLELSLAEHVGFGLAYTIASAGIVGLIGAYALAVLRRAGRAGILAGVVTTLYAYLFVLLTREDYALLAGALGLFAALAAVMWLTRRVDWRDVGAPRGAPTPPSLSA